MHAKDKAVAVEESAGDVADGQLEERVVENSDPAADVARWGVLAESLKGRERQREGRNEGLNSNLVEIQNSYL